MVWESSFAKTDKRCHACRKNFTVDEVYFSALALVVPNDKPTQPAETLPVSPKRDKPKKSAGPAKDESSDHFTRKDYCNPCWENTGSMDKDMFSFWQMRLVLKEQPKTPKDILLNFFDNMVSGQNLVQGSSPQEGSDIPTPEILQKQEMRPKVIYLFALILIRKRLLKLKQTAVKDGQRLLILERSLTTPVVDTKSNLAVKIYEIPDIDISQEELISLRDEFSRLFEFRI